MSGTPWDQSHRSMQIDSPLGANQVAVLSMVANEPVSAPFSVDLSVLTLASDDAVRKLLGQSVTIWFDNRNATDRRPLNGKVRRVAGPTSGALGSRGWQIRVVPSLSFMDLSVDIRIFQSMSVPDIVKKVLNDHGVGDWEFRSLVGSYPKLDYCVQYRESALAFVSRLMEHVGLFYWHEHRDGGHTLVVADFNKVATPALGAPAKATSASQKGDVEGVTEEYAFRSGKWTATDFDFEAPSKNLQTQEPTLITEPAMAQYEIYDYPGLYTNVSDGKSLTRARIEHEEAAFATLTGTGLRALLSGGRTLELSSPVDGGDGKYLLTSVVHTASEPEPGTGQAKPWTYQGTFRGVPLERNYRPARVTPKPFVQGIQTAKVTGPAGETIYTDEYGRVKVKFYWDRNPDGNADENSSCWLRVSQVWADNKWGAIHIPRIGEEVIVDFLEGDPDRPMITGRVYNGANPVPYKLPAHKTQSGIKSNSVPGPGSNELRFEDKKGHEEVYLHAQQDLVITVEADETDTIGHDRKTTVKNNDLRHIQNNSTDKIDVNEDRTVGGTFKEDVSGVLTYNYHSDVNGMVGGNLDEQIVGNNTQLYMSNYSQTVFGSSTTTVTGAVTVTATGGYTLNDPVNSLKLGPFQFSLYLQNNAIGVLNSSIYANCFQIYALQQQAIGLNTQATGVNLSVIGFDNNDTGVDVKALASTVKTIGTKVETLASNTMLTAIFIVI